MDFINQFEHTLEQTLSSGHILQARQLVDTFGGTQMPYTLKIYRLINRLRHTEHPFRLAEPPSAHRIVLFQTGNFILDYILKQFFCFFTEKNCSLLIFDPSDYEKSTQTLFTFAQQGIDAAFFFNNVGLSQTLQDGRNLWETLDIPCYDFLVDHPMYYADSLDAAPLETTVLCADRTHADYIRRFYPRVAQAVFFPTGGCPSATSNAAWESRNIDILFIGSYKYHSDYTPDALGKLISDYMQAHTNDTFEQAVEACACTQHDASLVSEGQLKELIEKHRYIETNVTARYRKTILTALLDAGMPIHVYGQGWETSGLTEHPCFILHAPVSFEEGLSLMENTKILLNHMAWFKHGSSERIFNAMASGAVCATDSSGYLDEILSDNKNCILYRLESLSLQDSSGAAALAEKVKTLLSNPKKASAIAKEGQSLASLHTWQQHIKHYLFTEEA